jgi:hypothetical protein
VADWRCCLGMTALRCRQHICSLIRPLVAAAGLGEASGSALCRVSAAAAAVAAALAGSLSCSLCVQQQQLWRQASCSNSTAGRPTGVTCLVFKVCRHSQHLLTAALTLLCHLWDGSRAMQALLGAAVRVHLMQGALCCVVCLPALASSESGMFVSSFRHLTIKLPSHGQSPPWFCCVAVFVQTIVDAGRDHWAGAGWLPDVACSMLTRRLLLAGMMLCGSQVVPQVQ